MTDQETLIRAIEKAIAGGWEQDLIWIHGNVKNKTEVFMKQLEIDDKHIYWDYDEYISVPELIFNHDFAKALWGDEPYAKVKWPHPNYDSEYLGAEYLAVTPHCQYHLQQMVIADDPIKYLGENL